MCDAKSLPAYVVRYGIVSGRHHEGGAQTRLNGPDGAPRRFITRGRDRRARQRVGRDRVRGPHYRRDRDEQSTSYGGGRARRGGVAEGADGTASRVAFVLARMRAMRATGEAPVRRVRGLRSRAGDDEEQGRRRLV